MLERRPHTLRLQTAHQRSAENTGQQRILGQVLEVAAAQRGSLDIDAGTEQYGNPLRAGLGAQRDPDPFQQVGIEGAPVCLRTPCGPSVNMIDGIPAGATGSVNQKFNPLVSDAFSVRVRSATMSAVGRSFHGSVMLAPLLR